MQQLLAQGAQAIIFYPLDPKATLPVLEQAKSKGVPVIAIDATFGNPKLPVAPGIVTQVWQGRDIMAFLQVQALKAVDPHAKVGLVGIGAPVPALKYLNQREAYYAKKAGMTVLGTQDNPTDDVTGGEKAGNGLIQRYSNMDAVIGYNDPSALGTVIAARGAGRKLIAIGLNGTSDGIAGVRNGQLAATVQGASAGPRIQSVTAADDLITKQHLPLPKVVVAAAADRDQGERQQDPELGRSSSRPSQVNRFRRGLRSAGPGRPAPPCQRPRSSAPTVSTSATAVSMPSWCAPARAPGRGARARGRERLGQVDAAEDPLRTGAARQRRDHCSGASRCMPQRHGGAAAGHRDGDPGDDARSRSLDRGERLPRASYGRPPRLHRLARHASACARGARPTRPRPRPVAAGAAPTARPAADGRDRARLSIDARVLILDEPTSSLTDDEVESLFGSSAGCARRASR